MEIPKLDGGVRKLGIPTVIDRIIQQAMSQQLMPIYEPKFSEGNFGYRPGRSAKDAVQKIQEYAEQGYTRAVVLDLSRYFDTLNHELLVNILRRDVKDERVIQMIKRYLRLGMPEWVACEGAYSRKAYWRMANAGVVKRALTKERLINWGFYDLATAYQSMHINY